MVNDRDSSSWKWRVGKVEPLMRLIAMEPSMRVYTVNDDWGEIERVHSHQEDRDGEFTIKEYIDVSGTEKAYDSGRWVGRSMRTASTIYWLACAG